MIKLVPPELRPERPASLAERSDDELVLLARAGAKPALAALVERHIGRLTSFCAKLLGDLSAAEDVVQETWIRLWALREAYRPEGKFVVLLFTTARNLCRNHARGARRRERWLPSAGSDVALDHITDGASDHLGALIERERQRGVHQALSELPEPMREAVLLRFDEALAYEDIAAIVGASESTVRSRVFHGVKRLRAHLTQEVRS